MNARMHLRLKFDMYSATGYSLGTLASPNLGLRAHGGDWKINGH